MSWHSLTVDYPPFHRFEQNYRPDGHTTQPYRFLVAFGTLVVAYSLISFPSYIVCMHILIDREYLPILIIAFLPPSPSHHVSADAHCRYQPHRIFSFVLPTITWARLHCYLQCLVSTVSCTSMPRWCANQFIFHEKKILSLIAKLVPEIASRLGVEFETPD